MRARPLGLRLREPFPKVGHHPDDGVEACAIRVLRMRRDGGYVVVAPVVADRESDILGMFEGIE